MLFERLFCLSTRALVAASSATVVVVSLISAPATAAELSPGSSPDYIENLLVDAGLIIDEDASSKVTTPNRVDDQSASQISMASIDLNDGLSVGSGKAGTSTRVTRLLPIPQQSSRALTEGGIAVYSNTRDSAFVLSTAQRGSNAGYVVITGPAAPTSYDFELFVDDAPAALVLLENGGVAVFDEAGERANSVAAPWAIDANGALISTSFSVNGNILTQTVNHEGAIYPVIGDPRLECDQLWCTLLLSKYETAQMADSALNAGIVCIFFGPGAPACAVLVIGGWAMANIARANGLCIGIRVWKANFISYMHLAYVNCYG